MSCLRVRACGVSCLRVSFSVCVCVRLSVCLSVSVSICGDRLSRPPSLSRRIHSFNKCGTHRLTCRLASLFLLEYDPRNTPAQARRTVWKGARPITQSPLTCSCMYMSPAAMEPAGMGLSSSPCGSVNRSIYDRSTWSPCRRFHVASAKDGAAAATAEAATLAVQRAWMAERTRRQSAVNLSPLRCFFFHRRPCRRPTAATHSPRSGPPRLGCSDAASTFRFCPKTLAMVASGYCNTVARDAQSRSDQTTTIAVAIP